MEELEVQEENCCSLFLRVLTIIPSILAFSYISYWNCKKTIWFPSSKVEFSINRCSILFPWKMATLRNRRNLADHNKDICKELPRNNFPQNSNVPRSQEDYTTQVYEKIETMWKPLCAPTSLLTICTGLHNIYNGNGCK